jgi:putative tryptophan/tyrosine transport system substrate-binding protein
MRRRDFMKAIAGSAAGWPLAARAQRPERMLRMSVLLGLAQQDPEAIARVKAFQLGMRDFGWIEGRNVQIDYRFAGNNQDSINRNVTELVQLAPDVIVANTTPILAALRPATSAIPIVFGLLIRKLPTASVNCS